MREDRDIEGMKRPTDKERREAETTGMTRFHRDDTYEEYREGITLTQVESGVSDSIPTASQPSLHAS